MPSSRREQLYTDLIDAMRDNASRTLMLHQAVADRLGLNFTDIKALDLTRNEPELTPGRLAELTGLRTSSVTALLDRLERRGMIARRRDATDRRKVIVEATGAHITSNQPIFAAIEDDVRRLLDDYDDDQLAAFLTLYARLNDMARDHADAISKPPEESGRATA
jgi:DNA-binding MarR family transcriptional regulator